MSVMFQSSVKKAGTFPKLVLNQKFSSALFWQLRLRPRHMLGDSSPEDTSPRELEREKKKNWSKTAVWKVHQKSNNSV